MTRHTILFLAADPIGTDQRALDREARAIQVELERSGFRDRFEFVTRWAAEPLDLLRELRKLKPTVVHFSGHGTRRALPTGRLREMPRPSSLPFDDRQHGLLFHDARGRAQLVSTAALQEAFGAAGRSVKLVVLSACYSEHQAKALLAHVDCVVGVPGAIGDDAARSFAIGFYGGLGERESVAAAHRQGCAAIGLDGRADGDRPQLEVRTGIDATGLVLADSPPMIAEGLASNGKHASEDGRVRRISDAALAIVRSMEDFWEQRLFAQALRDEIARHADIARDLRYGVAPHISTLDQQEFVGFASDAFSEASGFPTTLVRLFEQPLQDAMGPPGVAGNPDAICYVAVRIGEVYRSILDWGMSWHGVECAWPLSHRFLELMPRYLSAIVSAIEALPADIDDKVRAARNYRGDLPMTFHVSLVLDIPGDIQRELMHEIHRLTRKHEIHRMTRKPIKWGRIAVFVAICLILVRLCGT